MKSLLAILLLSMAGCAPHVVKEEAVAIDDGAVEIIRSGIRQLARSERDSVDNAIKAISMEKHGEAFTSVESIYTSYQIGWNQLFDTFRNGKISGTENWTTRQKDDLVNYAIQQRKLLSLADFKE